MKLRIHVYISGQVQGVFFRSSCKELADQLDLKGWVRNLPDGRVEAVFSGDNDKIEQMLAWFKKGPPGARVDDVQIKKEPY